uniref:Uncharacterized protein n=1 Tax=Zea mays TaxID=4577 RepID=A0A804RI68_MAIZE
MGVDVRLCLRTHDLDPSPGLKFQREMLHGFASSVHHPSACVDGSFRLIAVFRRFTFKLSEHSIVWLFKQFLEVPLLGFMCWKNLTAIFVSLWPPKSWFYGPFA